MKTKFLALFLVLSAIVGAACNSGQTSVTNGKSTTHMNHNNMNHSEMNHGNMNHQPMNRDAMNHSEMKSSPNAANAPYDLQFLDTMIAHHQGAVDMAKMAAAKAEHAELKALAANVITSQEKEIGEMKSWREKWFAGEAPAMNMEMAGMSDSMKDMDMTKLGSLTGNAFDLEFIEQMIPHHEGAVIMAKEALQKSQRAEIKNMANAIIRDQEAEIKQMKGWQAAWQK
ncbi:MAG TPA: DUF305 domain-containing protein [Pyrinomonadaceae bacterium]